MDKVPFKTGDQGTKRKRQLRHSIYHITVNPNQRFSGTESDFEEAGGKLKTILEDIFYNPSNYDKLFPLTQKAITEGNVHSSEFFKEVDVDVGDPELGPETRSLHIHITVELAHYTLVKVDNPFIQKAIAEKYGKNVYVNTKIGNAHAKNTREYIHKNRRD
jgi:hypothetical protein